MKALPRKLIPGQGYVSCPREEATHLTINLPGPAGILTLLVITSGSRKDTGCWSWNGDTEAPTLRPSVLNEGVRYTDENGKMIWEKFPEVKPNYGSTSYRCHTWINDGNAVYLEDTTHELRGQTVPLFDVGEQDLS